MIEHAETALCRKIQHANQLPGPSLAPTIFG
jgi:hypothetical protein